MTRFDTCAPDHIFLKALRFVKLQHRLFKVYTL